MTEEVLFPYQIEGAEWMAKKTHALLADEMGLGKSAQAVTACDIVGAQNILVICPASLRVNWSREFQRFSNRTRRCTLIENYTHRAAPGITVVSYDLVASGEHVIKSCRGIEWDVLILDEAHYLKERSARRTRAVYGRNVNDLSIARNARRIWRLSGTPAPNDASELWTHLKSAGIIKDAFYDFVYRFCSGFDSNWGFKITGHKNVPELKLLMSEFMLRRKKDDVMKQLPPIVYSHVTVEKSEVQLDPYFYENWRPIGIPKFVAELESADSAVRGALATASKVSKNNTDDKVKLLSGLSTSVATLRRYIGLAKLPKILEVLKTELEENPKLKLVLFAVHKDVIECSREALKKYVPVTVYGQTPAEKRQRHVDRFQNDPFCRVFIGNITAAGVGITLTAAHEVVFLESSWVPAENAQAAMRCHRIGQKKSVRVRFFSCAGSVDEDVQRVLIHKTRELAKIFD